MPALPLAFPFMASSGNPALDRRLDWAQAMLAEGEHADAAALLADTVAEAPHFAAAWFLLGEARLASGDQSAAAEAFARARAADPADSLGAGLRLARLGAAPTADAMSAAYVRTLFDQYADRFDTALRDKLAYRGPELLHAAVLEACARLERPPAFAHGLDLGCGTGLAAPLFAPLTVRLDGVDLSPAMLAKAERLGLYGALTAGDMGAALDEVAGESLDLVLAADALCYVGDLAPLFAKAARALKPGGLIAFTLETPGPEEEAPGGVLLRETLRYAHAANLVITALDATLFKSVLLEEASTRTEKGRPVPGLVVVAAKAR